MIDTHCHLLPEIDDGPESIGKALSLALLASQNGITHSIVTPHIHPGRYNNVFEDILTSFNDFQDALLCHGINIKLGMAAEVRICPELPSMLEKNLIPYLGSSGNYKVILLEMPHSHIPQNSDKLVRNLIDSGILPMIAHPERNKDVMRNLDALKPFVELGCLFQLTAGSVAGFFGSTAKKRADQILKNNWATVLASDAHNVNHRPPNLKPGRIAAERIVGESKSWDLVSTNPFQIVRQQFEGTLNLHATKYNFYRNQNESIDFECESLETRLESSALV